MLRNRIPVFATLCAFAALVTIPFRAQAQNTSQGDIPPIALAQIYMRLTAGANRTPSIAATGRADFTSAGVAGTLTTYGSGWQFAGTYFDADYYLDSAGLLYITLYAYGKYNASTPAVAEFNVTVPFDGSAPCIGTTLYKVDTKATGNHYEGALVKIAPQDVPLLTGYLYVF